MDSKNEEKEVNHKITSDVKAGNSSRKLKTLGSFNGQDMFVRADLIDLKNLDIKLEKKLSKAWLKNSGPCSLDSKEEWEIDPSKLNIRYVVAKGTYGTVYRGLYDGQDVAGIQSFMIVVLSLTSLLLMFLSS